MSKKEELERQGFKTYENGEIRVFWNPALCWHVGTCVKENRAAFDPKRRPWVDLSRASAKEIAAVIDLCPSKALQYEFVEPAARKECENKEDTTMEVKFYRCKHCGQIVTIVKKTGVPVVCCGEPMEELVPGTSDGAYEKHVPVWTVEGDKVVVEVGSVAHPMLEAHYIEWIALETAAGVQIKHLKPGEEPKRCFRICEGDEVKAVYEYCNLHGLWKA